MAYHVADDDIRLKEDRRFNELFTVVNRGNDWKV